MLPDAPTTEDLQQAGVDNASQTPSSPQAQPNLNGVNHAATPSPPVGWWAAILPAGRFNFGFKVNEMIEACMSLGP